MITKLKKIHDDLQELLMEYENDEDYNDMTGDNIQSALDDIDEIIDDLERDNE